MSVTDRPLTTEVPTMPSKFYHQTFRVLKAFRPAILTPFTSSHQILWSNFGVTLNFGVIYVSLNRSNIWPTISFKPACLVRRLPTLNLITRGVG